MGEGKRSDLWQNTKGGSLPRGGITHPLGDKITAIFSPRKPNSFPPATKFSGSKKSKCDKNSERVVVTTKIRQILIVSVMFPKTPTQNSK